MTGRYHNFTMRHLGEKQQTTGKKGSPMRERIKIIYWQDDNYWLGYIEEYPDYMTQGMTLEELKENLKDLYGDLSSGAIPCVRKEEELILA